MHPPRLTPALLSVALLLIVAHCDRRAQPPVRPGRTPAATATPPPRPRATPPRQAPPRRARPRPLPTYRARIKALVGGTVIDVRAGRALATHTVLVEGDRITRVGPAASVPVPPGADVIDVKGRFIIPGLVDGHIHFFQSGGLFTRPDGIDLRHRVPYEAHLRLLRARLDDTFRRYLASGVTAVVDNGGPMWNFDVRERARRSPHAPRVFVAGPLIASYQPKQLQTADLPIRRVTTVAEALALLRQQLARKPDLVKLWYVAAPALVKKGLALAPQAFLPIAKAVVAEAHRAKLPVYIHATELATAKLALQAGADVLVHSVVDAEVDDEFLRLARERRAFYVPTAWVFNSYASVYLKQLRLLPVEHWIGHPGTIGTLFQMHELADRELSPRVKAVQAKPPSLQPRPVLLRNLKKVLAAGLPVALGTDAGNIGVLHGPSVFHELRVMARAGVPPAQLLRIATWNGARLLRRQKDLGAVTPGRLADLVVLDANPLTDIRHVERVHLVVRGGQVHFPEQLVPRTPAALAQIQLNAYNARDVDTFASVYHPAVEVFDFPGGAPKLRGRAALRTRYAAFFAKAPDLHCRLVSRIVQSRFVFDREEVTGIPGRPKVQATAIYEIQDRLIRRVWFVR